LKKLIFKSNIYIWRTDAYRLLENENIFAVTVTNYKWKRIVYEWKWWLSPLWRGEEFLQRTTQTDTNLSFDILFLFQRNSCLLSMLS